jgi:hypothetical protein
MPRGPPGAKTGGGPPEPRWIGGRVIGGGGSGVLGPEGGRFGIDPGRTGSEAFRGPPR